MHTILTKSPKYIDLGLTDQELEILHMIAFDYTIDEMGVELGCQGSEIIALEQSLYTKMGVETTAGLMRAAFEQGFLRLVSQ